MKKWLSAILVLLLGGVGSAFMIKSKVVSAPLKTEEKVWNVDIQLAKPELHTPQVNLYARLESPRSAALTAAVNADVVKVLVREGQRVAQGQLLIQLDDQDMQLNLQQKQADIQEIKALIQIEKNRYASDKAALPKERSLLKLAEKSAQRTRKLRKQLAGSESAVDEALKAVELQALTVSNRKLKLKNHAANLQQLEAQHQRALAALAQRQRDVGRTRIHAPFAAIISTLDVSIGDRVAAGKLLLNLYDPSALEARAQIPRRHEAAISVVLAQMQTLSATTQLQGKAITFKLERLAGSVRQSGSGLDAFFVLAPETATLNTLRLGQFINLTLSLPPIPDTLSVPYEAIYAGNQLYKLKDGRMHNIQVQLRGESLQTNASSANAEAKIMALVSSPDISAQDKIIITQLPNAIPGLKVKQTEVQKSKPDNPVQ
ncbi:efflux RND transporter periplasmic adaptor subunit [Candidatus Venteria ishoeyi]|uniref:Multidrug resistance protein MdtN n=1 Tax=Candidatus Venteria ishoeyi TaxID=1899563 RepID=A0A1H6FGV9_9GAMM|nr:HlyD family efflux transporter periplasmic adaptor subunit [Candidatus Venteria ishoeyi]SEH09153.1 multidrug resistance protein MdtN [Candidatus Venteria ishoeyi]SEH09282.1 multidrug resistance protein MdtN [Candidatus Venteria ishoeyi]